MGALTVCAVPSLIAYKIQPEEKPAGLASGHTVLGRASRRRERNEDRRLQGVHAPESCVLDKLMRDEYGRKKADYDALGDDERKNNAPPPTLQRILDRWT